MKKSTKFDMFVEAKGYIDKFHSNNPMDFVSNVYVFYYMSGRFPTASMHDCCSVVEALRKHYMSEFSVIDDNIASDDELSSGDELPFY